MTFSQSTSKQSVTSVLRTLSSRPTQVYSNIMSKRKKDQEWGGERREVGEAGAGEKQEG